MLSYAWLGLHTLQVNIRIIHVHTVKTLCKLGFPLVYACRWSSGVIMYTLLAGSPPFWHRKQMMMLRMILAGSYDFSSPEWEDRSDTVKDLVRCFSPLNPFDLEALSNEITLVMSKYLQKGFNNTRMNKLSMWFPQISRMLVVDPKQRFTATDVLNHSFFSQYVVDEVRQFSPYRRFKVRCLMWPNFIKLSITFTYTQRTIVFILCRTLQCVEHVHSSKTNIVIF